MSAVTRKTPLQLNNELTSLTAQIRRVESSCGGNWRVIRQANALRDKRDALVRRIHNTGLPGEAMFSKVLDIETTKGFYDTVESLNEFELRAIVRGLCLSHERLRLDYDKLRIGGVGE